MSNTEKENASVTIGVDTIENKWVRIDQEARKLSTYIIGMQGMGKSSLLEHIVLGDIANGDGLCFIDPHGQSADYILRCIPKEREDDVIFWDVSNRERPFGINPFYCTTEDEVDNCGDDFIDALQNLEEFRKAFENSVRISELLRDVATTLAVNQGNLTQAVRFLEEEAYRRQFYGALDERYPQIRRFWERYDQGRQVTGEHINATLNKLRRFEDNRRMRGIFGQPSTTIDFREAMDEGKIIIVKMSPKIRENNASFIGTFIIWELAKAVDSRKHSERQFHLIVDEFSRFMTGLFSRLSTQARKQGIDVTVAHQIRDQISGDMLKGSTVAVGNKIIFRTSGKDGYEMAKELDFSPKILEVLREQSIPGPSFDPVAQLLRQGHRNPVFEPLLAQLTSVQLRWRSGLEGHSWSVGGGMSISDDGGFQYGSSVTVHGHPNMGSLLGSFQERIRAYLYQRMQGIADVDFLCPELVPFFIVNVIRVPNYEYEAYTSTQKLRETIATQEVLFQTVNQELQLLDDARPRHSREETAHLLSVAQSRVEFVEGKILELTRYGHMVDHFQGKGLMAALNRPREQESKYRGEGVNFMLVRFIDERFLPTEWKDAYELLKRHRSQLISTDECLGELQQKLEEAKSICAKLKQIEEYWVLGMRTSHRRTSIEEPLQRMQQVYADVSVIMQLGDALDKYPLQTQTGEYEKVYAKENLHNIELERANTLSRLSLYTADCSLTQGKHVVEYTIETLPQTEPDSEGIERAKRIIAKSYRDYGSDEEPPQGMLPPDVPPTPGGSGGSSSGKNTRWTDDDEPLDIEDESH